ncbi:calcineurin-like phosphoesterase family protein [Jatrophihabitans sp. GAS493]|nr:calcineurin-like phosphoesterase family protein [Jatrophihabitans sp. GAS493]
MWVLRLSVALGVASLFARALPFRATVDGVPFRVEATLFTRRGLSADTTLGSWQFPRFTGLPIGVHVSPVDVDLLRLTRAANQDTPAYVAKLSKDFSAQLPQIAAWLIGEIVLGMIIGLVFVALLEMAVRYLRGIAPRAGELVRRLRQLGGGLSVLLLVGAFGALTYDPDWAKESKLTGTLASFQLFPDQLKQYYLQQSKAYDALGSVIGIQAALQQTIEQRDVPTTSFNVMFISDMHLAAVYPLVLQYAQNFDVKLIVNTGDESEFGSSAEMTPTYVASIANLTKTIPMIWVAGNHDSADVASVMAGIRGVTVLGGKTKPSAGEIAVAPGYVNAFGLTIAGIPDPRVYGAAGVYGSNDDSGTDKLERRTIDDAVKGASKSTLFDMFMTHEPNAAAQLTHDLPGQIRQTNSGHLHAQNETSQIQSGSNINLVEGSTGAGGLDNIERKSTQRPPVEFSIESVADNCEFTKLLRFQLNNAAVAEAANAATFGQDVTVSTLYFKTQKVDVDRVCTTTSGIGKAVAGLPIEQ